MQYRGEVWKTSCLNLLHRKLRHSNPSFTNSEWPFISPSSSKQASYFLLPYSPLTRVWLRPSPSKRGSHVLQESIGTVSWCLPVKVITLYELCWIHLPWCRNAKHNLARFRNEKYIKTPFYWRSLRNHWRIERGSARHQWAPPVAQRSSWSCPPSLGRKSRSTPSWSSFPLRARCHWLSYLVLRDLTLRLRVTLTNLAYNDIPRVTHRYWLSRQRFNTCKQ